MVAGVAAAIWFIVGCAASEPPANEQGQAAMTSTSTATAAGGCSPTDPTTDLESILAFVPDTAANREYVTVADLQAFLDDQGKELPGDFREIRFVDPVTLFTPTPLLQDALSQANEDEDPLADEFGIGLGQIRMGVSAGLAPDVTELLIGDVDPAAVETAVAADPFWSEQQETVESNGETFYSWGGDNEVQVKGGSPIRKLGIGGRLWVTDGIAAYTRSTPVMEALLAGCSGAEATLADDDAYAGMAQRLDDFDGAFRVVLTDQVREPGAAGAPEGSSGTAAEADDTAPLEGVTAYGFASGPSSEPDQARIRLVLASGSDAEATANADAFVERVESGTSATTSQPWSDLLRVERIEADGPFVVVELLADNAQVLESYLLRRDSLVVSS